MAVVLRLGFAILVGFVVFFVLAPTSGSGIGCYSMLRLEVSCNGAVAAAFGAASATVVGVGLWFLARRRAANR